MSSGSFVKRPCTHARGMVAAIVMVVVWAIYGYGIDESAIDREFTVQDSIGVSYIVNPFASTFPEMREFPPVGFPIVSPDQKHFLLITQKGVLANNCIESTLWLFNSSAVIAYVAHRDTSKPIPKAIATMCAASNTPVISDVRWLQDSRRIAFLGKRDGAHQQLFIVGIAGRQAQAITKRDLYVSQYDIEGKTVVYTSLIVRTSRPPLENKLVDVTGEGIYDLLFPQKLALENQDDWALNMYPNELHVIKSGRDAPVVFTMNGKPLRLFTPTLSLSPDGRSLITVAPIDFIPALWGTYRPAFSHMKSLNLKPGNSYALAEENPWKASWYVIVDLKTGIARSIINAPAGRVLGYVAPTKAFWMNDSHKVVLTNSFLPLESCNQAEKLRRENGPAIVMVDLRDLKPEKVDYLDQGEFTTKSWHRIDDISWRGESAEVTVTYEVDEDGNAPQPRHYLFKLGQWISHPIATGDEISASVRAMPLVVVQDLNHPPRLFGHVPGDAESSMVWDPNSWLEQRNIGDAKLFKWHDQDNNKREGILVLPPRFDPKQRYPLVIQTHGFDSKRFFADGEYSTGSGGRALSAKGIVVLQMDMPMIYFTTPEDGPYEAAGFESAIGALSTRGFIDRNRVGVIGFSYSCFHVLYTLTHHPALFAAASITDGNNMSYVQYILSTDTHNALQEISEKTNGGIPFGAGLSSWSHNAPNFELDRVKTPLLVSSLEKGELLAQWETYSGLRTLHKPVDMVWLPRENAPHILVKPQQRYMSQQMAVDWFDFWLNGHEDSDQRKHPQYVRWRELRKLQNGDPSAVGASPNPH
ncbi:MAG TPA: prolyl oligopeptidase family serine peptidase [Terriglobales bacterium]|nr:prolyl oligopeptidase family serine peptidase [Terriglobales bacterium]